MNSLIHFFAAPALCPIVLLVSVTAAPGPLFQDVSVRLTYPEDVQGIWQLVEEVGTRTICPASIRHTTYSVLDGIQILPHNTIEQNDIRCDSIGNEKSLQIFESDKYDADLNPKDAATPSLPEPLVQSILSNGRVINIYNALVGADERFMIGFEPKLRVCNKLPTLFKPNTTMFFARPFDITVTIRNVDTQLLSGYKYMLIVPTNQATTCVYEINIDALTVDPDFSQSPSSFLFPLLLYARFPTSLRPLSSILYPTPSPRLSPRFTSSLLHVSLLTALPLPISPVLHLPLFTNSSRYIPTERRLPSVRRPLHPSRCQTSSALSSSLTPSPLAPIAHPRTSTRVTCLEILPILKTRSPIQQVSALN